jgi:hypothetical protein
MLTPDRENEIRWMFVGCEPKTPPTSWIAVRDLLLEIERLRAEIEEWRKTLGAVAGSFGQQGYKL